jgi:multiple sugar transport system substrate-binding protein
VFINQGLNRMARMKHGAGGNLGLLAVSLAAAMAAGLVSCGGTDTSGPGAGGSGGGSGSGGAGTTGGRGGGGGASGGVGGGAGAGGAGGGGAGAGGAGGTVVDAATPDAPDAPASVQLRIAWWGGMPRQDRTTKVIDLFRQQHPEVSFVLDTAVPTSSTDYWKKLDAAALAGDLPDIMQHDHKYLNAWAARGDLLVLDDLVRDGVIKLDDVPRALSDGGRIAGKLVGINLGSNTQGMIVDVDALTRAGIALPADSWTWQDFNRIVTELKTKAQPPLTWGYGISVAADGIWKGLYLSHGGWVFNATNNGIGYSDDKPLVDHLTMALALQRADAITPRVLQVTPPGQTTKAPYDTTVIAMYPIVSGKSAIEFTSGTNLVIDAWVAAEAFSMGPRKLKVYPLPRLPGGGSAVYIKPSQYFSITSKTKHPREAAMFLDFVTNSVAANDILAAERGAPVNTKVMAALKAALDLNTASGKGTAASFEILERVAADARPLPAPDPAVYSMITAAYNEAALNPVLLDNTIEPAAAAAAFRARVNQIFAGTPPDGGAGDGGADGGADAGTDGGSDAGADAAGDGPVDDRQVLLVVGALPLAGNDTAIATALAGKVTLVPVLDTAVTTEMATGKAAVIISATASVAGAGTKFRDVATPVIVMEPNLYGPMLLTGTAAGSAGTLANQTQVTIVAPDNHPLAAALTGAVTVYSAPYRLVYGLPGAGAVKIASVVGSATQTAIFAYPAGAAMVGGNAPGRRVGFYLHNSAAANAAPDGLKLLAAAVDWATAP